jgi:hypothetical protein
MMNLTVRIKVHGVYESPAGTCVEYEMQCPRHRGHSERKYLWVKEGGSGDVKRKIDG